MLMNHNAAQKQKLDPNNQTCQLLQQMIAEMLLEVASLFVASLILVLYSLGTLLLALLNGLDFGLLRVADTNHAHPAVRARSDVTTTTTTTSSSLTFALAFHVDIAILVTRAILQTTLSILHTFCNARVVAEILAVVLVQ